MTTTASTVDVAKHQQKGGQVPRPQKPDQEKFKAQVADVEKEMEQIRADLVLASLFANHSVEHCSRNTIQAK